MRIALQPSLPITYLTTNRYNRYAVLDEHDVAKVLKTSASALLKGDVQVTLNVIMHHKTVVPPEERCFLIPLVRPVNERAINGSNSHTNTVLHQDWGRGYGPAAASLSDFTFVHVCIMRVMWVRFPGLCP